MYTIDPDGHGAFQVRCEMDVSSGRGWTVFQQRLDGSVNFYRKWTDYKTGFGNLNGEFWLGLDKIHRLSASGQNVLRVDLESFEKETRFAEYKIFSVGNESKGYILHVGQYQGNILRTILRTRVVHYLIANNVRSTKLTTDCLKF